LKKRGKNKKGIKKKESKQEKNKERLCVRLESVFVINVIELMYKCCVVLITAVTHVNRKRRERAVIANLYIALETINLLKPCKLRNC